jgi:tRNA nucleotidyltransferase (CCA-adding enzyme)
MSITEMEQEAREVLNRLIENGYQAYFVGGYVRDLMTGRNIKDIDIATSAKPDEVMAIFHRTVPTGLQHGTVTVVWNVHTFEVTTFRKEANYENFRRPERVTFIEDLLDDLGRRDFTMNAMALDRDGNLVDPFGGLHDLSCRRIQCVGHPAERFAEDALRMMRCIRFAAEYGLNVEESTWGAIESCRAALQHIAMERIRSELEKIVEGNDPRRGLELIVNSLLFRYFKADLQLPSCHTSDKCLNSEKLTKMRQYNDPDVRWACLFILLRLQSRQAEYALRQLTFSIKRINTIVRLLEVGEWLEQRLSSRLDEKVQARDEAVKSIWIEAALAFGKPVLEAWLSLLPDAAEYYKISAPNYEAVLSHGNRWLNQIPVVKLQQLAISGDDIKKSGVAEGPKIGQLLNLLLRDAANGRVANSKEELMQLAAAYAKKVSL